MNWLSRLRRPARVLPPEHLQTYVGSDDDFAAVGAHFLALFERFGGLTPHQRVLDIGCGSGRLAAPLADFLSPEASYEGFDISAEAVEWCRLHITPQHPNFRFEHVDIANTHYNPEGSLTAEDFTFPYADATFDFAFATSIFTHMLPAGVDRYLEEVTRVLRPGGRFFVTVYAWNADTEARAASGVLQVPFPHEFGVYRTASDVLEAVVAYDERYLLERIETAGLRLVGDVHTGDWTGRPPPECPTFQDLIVADRP